MLERLAEHDFYLLWVFRYNQIAIAPKDQEKITFTCPYGTFLYRRMPFAIFDDMVEKFIEIFIGDFFFGSSFDICLLT